MKRRVVLARPRTGENIGFVVRLCANHDIDDLVLVQPAPDWRERAMCTASMCRELLGSVRTVDRIDAAIADCDVVVGLTARQGRERPSVPIDRIRSVASMARKLALVFGNEESGLDREESAVCTDLLRIDRPGLASLNLSHAVAIALHELDRGQPSDAPAAATEPSVTTHDDRQLLATRIRDSLSAWRFSIDDPHFDGALARLIEARALQKRDARVLLKVLRHLDWVRETSD